MRKLFGVLVLSLLTAALLPTSALATHSNGPGPGKDFVNGTARGTVPTPCGSPAAHFHTNGQSILGDGAATGQFFTDIDFTTLPAGNCLGFTSATFSGDVTCVHATSPSGASPGFPENAANWGGAITDVLLQPGDVPGIPGILFPGMGVLSRHVDNGEPGKGNDRNVGFPTPTPPLSCPVIPFSTTPITQGNLIVHDGATDAP
jgi:hypothetical protein